MLRQEYVNERRGKVCLVINKGTFPQECLDCFVNIIIEPNESDIAKNE